MIRLPSRRIPSTANMPFAAMPGRCLRPALSAHFAPPASQTISTPPSVSAWPRTTRSKLLRDTTLLLSCVPSTTQPLNTPIDREGEVPLPPTQQWHRVAHLNLHWPNLTWLRREVRLIPIIGSGGSEQHFRRTYAPDEEV